MQLLYSTSAAYVAFTPIQCYMYVQVQVLCGTVLSQCIHMANLPLLARMWQV